MAAPSADHEGSQPSNEDTDFSPEDARREVMARHARLIAERHGDGQGPVRASQVFKPPPDMTPVQGIGMLAVLALFMLSPLAGDEARAALGVRGFAALALSLALVAAVTMRGATSSMAPSAWERGLLVLLLAGAVVTGAPVLLDLLPAAVHGFVGRLMLASLKDEESLVEQGARIFQPLAPDFIRPYCRKLTVWWGLIFLGSAVVMTVLALSGAREAWQAWIGWMFWAGLGAFVVAEFVFRKAWFRYFGPGPLDQALARIWPPANTARGRRSQAYMDLIHEEIARLAEAERSS